MGIAQFKTSLARIYEAENTSTLVGVQRHIKWQFLRHLHTSPIVRPISDSWLLDDEPGDVMALVNSLGMYDFNNMTFFRDLLTSGGIFVDGGANIGAYSILLSENEAVRVISIEPAPKAYAKLVRNVALNSRSNVQTIEAALSGSSSSVRLLARGSSSTNEVVNADVVDDNVVVVASVSLDDVLGSVSSSPIVLKLDIEGFEPTALSGLNVQRDRVSAISIENGCRPEILEFAKNADLLGPLYAHARSRSLRRIRTSGHEDELFISPGTMPRGWAIRV